MKFLIFFFIIVMVLVIVFFSLFEVFIEVIWNVEVDVIFVSFEEFEVLGII